MPAIQKEEVDVATEETAQHTVPEESEVEEEQYDLWRTRRKTRRDEQARRGAKRKGTGNNIFVFVWRECHAQYVRYWHNWRNDIRISIFIGGH